MRTLSITETAPASLRLDPFAETAGKLVPHSPETRNKRDIIQQYPLPGVFADLTSKHEHNHFVRHCASEFGVLLTILLIMHHEQRKTIFFAGMQDPRIIDSLQMIEQLRITERTIECLMSSSTMLTEGEAVDALNQFYSLTFGVAPFTTNYPERPACPSGFLGYINILECSAILLEHSHLGVDSSERIAEEDRLLRSAERDPLTYMILPTILIEKLGSIGVASIATALSLECRVPLFASELDGPIAWDNFHPGYRLYKLVESFPKADAEYLANLRSQNPEKAWQVARSYRYQIGHYDRFRTIALDGFGMSMWEKGDPAISVEGWMRKATPPFGSYFAKRYTPDMWQGVIDHLIYSFNAFRKKKETAFLQLAGATDFVFIGNDLDTGSPRGLDLTADQFPDLASNALFSVTGGIINSTHLLEKPEDVLGGVRMMIEVELLDCALDGLGKAESVERVKAIGSFEISRLQELHVEWIEAVADQFFPA
jgi:hypothetical protein